MATSRTTQLYVVDGSNIATEGRSTPSLEQLNEAVISFMAQYPRAEVTVVVDATFGHRIPKKEVKAFDEAVANNELVTPPAGAIGRGDAFVLMIANQAGAGVLSNDSFQEFHGDYDWLFEEGRLIGGKPVPHVGWVFVPRSPVRGPKSRRAVREARSAANDTEPTDAKQRAQRRVRKKAAAEPADAAPAGRTRRRRSTADAEQQATIEAAKAATGKTEHVNELMPFLEFVEHHPVGTSCTGVVESYSSHGAYARVDDVLVYLPLRLMDDPPPRSARSVLKTGEAVAFVIVGYVPDRRSIDAALPHMADAKLADQLSGEAATADHAAATTSPKQAAKRAAAKKPATKRAAKKEPAPPKEAVAKKEPAAKKAPAKKEPAAKKAPAKKKAAATKTAATKQSAKKTTASKQPAKKTAAKKTAATTQPAKKTATKQPAKKTTASKQPAAKKTAATKQPVKKTGSKKAAPKRSGAKKTATGAQQDRAGSA